MKILANIPIFGNLTTTQVYRTIKKDGKTLLLCPISEEQYLAIQLHPDRIEHHNILPEETYNYRGLISPTDHQAELLKRSDLY